MQQGSAARPRAARNARIKGLMIIALGLLLAGCGAQQHGEMAASAGAAEAVASPDGAFLAYEHDVRVQLPGEQIGPRLRALTQACQQARFGDCAVLQANQDEGERPSASVRVRLAPAAVEPFIALAGEQGRVAGRNTQAEDLAQQVADTQLTQARLRKEHEILQGFQQRRDMSVADLLSLSQRMAELEAQLQQADREAAQQRRRIDTQLLTVYLSTPASESGRSEIGEALRDSGAVFTTSVAFVIRAVAALLPVLLVGGGALWLALYLWRRRRQRKAG